MWVKRSESEIKQRQTCLQRSRLPFALFMGFVALFLGLFYRGVVVYVYGVLMPAAQQDPQPFSANEMLYRLPLVLIVACLVAVFFYIIGGKKQYTMICPGCGAAKAADSILICPCGNHFEDLDTMKWVEDGSAPDSPAETSVAPKKL
jgi:hypothetical protein